MKKCLPVILAIVLLFARFETKAQVWTTPMTQNGSYLNQDINSVYFTSDFQGWAVGARGTILTTAGGGTNWSIQSSGTTNNLNSVFFISPAQGWVVGDAGTILSTSDGGITWTAQTSGTTQQLKSVYFISASQGWVVGAAGTIRTTNNGGSTWTTQTSGTTNALNSVCFTSATQGWAVGAAGTIRTTNNGGTTWTGQTSGTTNILNSVYFTSSTQGWAVGAGSIRTTNNGGTTWTGQASGTTNVLNSVYFTSSTQGWAVGTAGTIRTTSNGGSTWTGQTSATTNDLKSVYFTSVAQGWVGGIAGSILSTSNSGSTWTVQTSGTLNSLYGSYFVSNNQGWVVGTNYCIFNTTDGAVNINPQSSGAGAYYNAVYFTSNTQGWTVGTAGKISTTSDGGLTWTSQASGTTSDLYSVHFVSATQGWAVGAGGIIHTTNNGGVTWTAQSSGTTNTLWYVYFTSATQGWAVGVGGTIRTTNNGGLTWTAQSSGTTNTLWSVNFTSATQGWAVGDGGIIRTTSDGGVTWTAQTSGTTQNLYSVYFTSASQGWAVGAGGTILTTNNGGTTWVAQASGTTSWLWNTFFTSPNNGWAFGDAGTVLLYKDGNQAPTNMALSSNSINENVPPNSAIGNLSTTDINVGNTFAYTLVSGPGSTDNAAFNISSNSLRITNSPDFETKNSFTIRVRSTDQGGLFFDKVYTITINDVCEVPAPTITASGPTTFCPGGSVVLTSSSATGNTWSTGATTPSITVNASGTYSVTVSSGSCTPGTSIGTTITVNSIPATPTISGSTTFCAGGSVVLTSSSATGYTWSTGATTPSITVNSSGTFTVAVTSSNGCTSANSLGTTVTMIPLPTTPTITASGPTTFCAGGSVILTSSSASSYLWSTGATTPSITVNSSGTYTVAVTNNGCTSANSLGTTVTVNPIPVTPTITTSGSTIFCAGVNVVLTSSSATGNTWSTGATTKSITATTSGMYTVTATANACTSPASVGMSVTVIPLPAQPTVTAPVYYTPGATASPLTATGTNLLWYNSATGGTGSSTAPTPSTSTVGTTSYYVSQTINGCESPSRAKIDVIVALPATHLHFDGVNDKINLGTSLNTLFDTLNTITLEAWVKPQSNTGNGVIIGNFNNPANQMQFLLRRDGVSYTFRVNDGTGNKVVTASNSVVVNTWQHIAGVWNGSDMRIYVNGVLISTLTGVTGSSFATVTNSVAIGANSSEFYWGSIDEVRIWNKALSAEEIRGRKNCEVQVNELGLVAYYKFNQGFNAVTNAAVTSLTDSTSNAINGSLSNFALNGATSNWLAGSVVTTGITVPSAPSANAQTFCHSATVANLIPAPNATTNWYNVATGGAVLSSTTALTTGTYYVTSLNGNGCESARTSVTVNVIVVPIPTVTANVYYLIGDTASPLTATGTNLLWYASATGGTGSSIAPTPNTSSFSSTSYYVSQTIGGCEGLTRAKIDVGVSFELSSSLHFDGLNDKINLGTSLNSIFDPLNKITLEAWVKPGSNTGNGVIIGNNMNPSNQMQFMLRRDGTSYTFWVNDGTGTKVVTASNSVVVNTWQYIAGVWNGSDMRIYVNGVLISTLTGVTGSSFATVTNSVTIGGHTSEYFNGNIDEVRIWNKALTIEELSSRYTCELRGNELGLVAYYKFNQGYVSLANIETTLIDATSNAINGALSNFALSGNTSNWSFSSNIPSGLTIPSKPYASAQTLPMGSTVSDLVPKDSLPLYRYWYLWPTTFPSPVYPWDILTTGTYYVKNVLRTGCESELTSVAVTITSSPLPIELLYFKAQLNSVKAVDLTWATATELNNDYFVIQRSKDGVVWEDINQISGHGTSVFQNNYSTVDFNPLDGISYYRLKQVDFDGTTSYSNMEAVEIASSNNIIVKPNPFTNLCTIEFNGITDLKTIEVYNSLGVLVKYSNIGNSEQKSMPLDFTMLASGIYYLKLDGNNKYQKLIKL